MFLSKKNAAYLNKPSKGKVVAPRVLPGWGDDEENTEDYHKDYIYTSTPKLNTNLLDDTPQEHSEPVPATRETSSKKLYYDWDELNDMDTIECEKKLVETMVEPGGIRIKPNDNLLADFIKECKGMDPTIVGSLLLSKVEVNYPFQIKAKSLYTIDYLVKKNPSYSSYFKTQTDRLKEFPEPEDNVENYRKVLKTVLNSIGVAVNSAEHSQESTISFVDPGYNDAREDSGIRGIMNDSKPKKEAKKPNTRKLISPNDTKKTMQGPTKAKRSEQIFDILGNSEGNKQGGGTGLENLLTIDQPVENKFTFDDLLNSSAPPKRDNLGFDFSL